MSCELIRRGFNDTYLVKTGDVKFIFRIYLNNKYYIESHDAFRFELDLLEHFANDGIAVSNALRTNSGELLGSFNHKDDKRAFALFVYAQDDRADEKSFSAEQACNLGKAMAEMHLSANHFKSSHKRYHLDFKYLITEPLRLIEERLARNDTSKNDLERAEEINKLLESLQPIEQLQACVEKIDVSTDAYGIIHADMHPGNVHFQGNNPTVFDFDHCAYGWRAYDLAVSHYFPASHRDAMIQGYELTRRLHDTERDAIPALFKLRRLWDVGDMMAINALLNA